MNDMMRKRQDTAKFFQQKGRALLSFFYLLLMLCLGGFEAWGQTTDYSGTYYIASYAKVPDSNPAQYFYNPADPNNSDNYYLCPSDGWIYYKKDNKWTADKASSDGPFLTTFKCRTAAYNDYGGMNNAKWVVTKHGDYYTFYHTGTSKYLVLSSQINGCGADRMRVHLEEITSPETDNNALFTIASDGNPGFYIEPKAKSGDRLTVNGGNKNSLKGESGKKDGPKGTGYNYENTAGIVGIYRGTGVDDNRYFYLEDYITRPTITFNDATEEITITAVQLGVNLIYTTDGSTPSTSNPNAKTITGTEGNTTTVTFNPSDGETTIKAVAVVGSELSNIATYTTPVYIGENHKYLIQSQNNGWTIDENTTDFHFYMIPGDKDNNVTKVNTTSLFRPSMEWHFLNAGIENGVQYYYVVNNANSMYLAYDSSNSVYMDDFTEDNKFKFKILESPTAGTYNIYPYGQNNIINKNTNNANAAAINTATYSASNANSANTRWKFILPTDLDTNAPFTVSNTSVIKFYQIANVGGSGHYIIPPTGNNTNAITSNSTTDADIKRGSWYFEEAQAATASDWCTYYYIRNAETGKYLYFIRDANNVGACLEMRSTIESGQEDRYMFTWAKTADINVNYYIIPKLLKDVKQNSISSLRKHDSNTSIITNVTRGAGNYAWTFVEAPLFCHNPVFEESGGNIIMSCNMIAAEIRYTTNGQDPKADGVTCLTYPPSTPLSVSDQHLIKAYAVVSDGTNSAPSEDVVILLNKPDITLEAGPYEYKGEAWEPSFTVSIGESGSETTAPTSPASYSTTYSDNINAGEATVTLTDADEEDNWYIWNASTTFTIAPKELTITPDDNQSKELGDDDPQLTYSKEGIVDGDEWDEVLSGELSRDEGENVGTYTIYQGTLTANSNYTIAFTDGKIFTITGKSIGDGETPANGITIEIVKNDDDSFTTTVRNNGQNMTVGTEGTDYDYSITSSGDASTKYYEVTITGANNYSGGFKAKYANIALTKADDDTTPGGACTFVTNSSGDGDIATPDNMTAYIVTAVNSNTVTIEVVDYIPEDMPVLLLSNVNAKGFQVQPRAGGEDVTDEQKTDNLLKVETADRLFDMATIYLLYKGEFVLNAEGTLAAGKIYLPNPNAPDSNSGSRGESRLKIIRSESTGIEDTHLSSSPLSEFWYSLDGQRLSGKPSQKGLYLQNGKKIVIK